MENLLSNYIKKMKCVKTISKHINRVNSLLRLKDGKIASCSYDKTIRIFDPSNSYQFAQVLKRHSDYIYSICQLEKGTIVSCSLDRTIMIGDYTIKNAHDGCIYKVITLLIIEQQHFSSDNTIKIWKSNKSYSDKLIKVMLLLFYI